MKSAIRGLCPVRTAGLYIRLAAGEWGYDFSYRPDIECENPMMSGATRRIEATMPLRMKSTRYRTVGGRLIIDIHLGLKKFHIAASAIER